MAYLSGNVSYYPPLLPGYAAGPFTPFLGWYINLSWCFYKVVFYPDLKTNYPWRREYKVLDLK